MASILGHEHINRVPLSSDSLDRAHQAFQNLVQRYEDRQLDLQAYKSYKKITLIKETYSHCKDQDAFLQHFVTTIGAMHYQDTASDLARGLSTIEDFLSRPPADHQAKLLFDYADELLIFYIKSRPSCPLFEYKLPCLYHYYSEDPVCRRCFKNTQSSLQTYNTQWAAQGDTPNRLSAPRSLPLCGHSHVSSV